MWLNIIVNQKIINGTTKPKFKKTKFIFHQKKSEPRAQQDAARMQRVSRPPEAP